MTIIRHLIFGLRIKGPVEYRKLAKLDVWFFLETNTMKMISKFRDELRRSPITICITVFGIIISSYFVLKKDKTVISFEVIHKFNVLRLNRDVKDLEILFRKADMVKEGLSLTFLNMKITNTGDMNLKKGDFDADTPWGLKIVNGELIKVTPDTNDNYLKKELEKLNTQKEFVELPFFMFDKGKSFNLEILVLHKKDASLKPVMQGKISGMDEFTHVTKTSQKESILLQVFSGGTKVQWIRGVAYFLGYLVLFFILMTLPLFIEVKNEKRVRSSRKKNVDQYPLEEIANKPGGRIIVDVYLSKGKEGLKILKDSIAPDVLKFSALATKLEVDYRSRHFEGDQVALTPIFVNPKLSDVIGTALRKLIEESLIYQNGSDWNLKEEFKDLLDAFIKRIQKVTSDA